MDSANPKRTDFGKSGKIAFSVVPVQKRLSDIYIFSIYMLYMCLPEGVISAIPGKHSESERYIDILYWVSPTHY